MIVVARLFVFYDITWLKGQATLHQPTQIHELIYAFAPTNAFLLLLNSRQIQTDLTKDRSKWTKHINSKAII